MLDDHFRAMARNNAWSNHRLLAACGRLSSDAYFAPRTSFFPSIHLTLNHILIVDWYYIDALEAGGLGPQAYADETPCADFVALEAAQRDADRRLIAWCDAADEACLAAPVTLVRAAGKRHEERAAEVLAHLFIHQIHHRGQVHAMLSGSDVPPPQLDEFFLRQDAHLRADELAELARRGLG
jgi:uncharacterized damage-inducible protein DinB